jgi:hypothetical protein
MNDGRLMELGSSLDTVVVELHMSRIFLTFGYMEFLLILCVSMFVDIVTGSIPLLVYMCKLCQSILQSVM